MPEGQVVIVGAGLAGVRTAEQLRQHGHHGAIVLVGEESEPPYDRPPLSKQVLRGERDVVPLRDPGSYAELGVDLRLGTAAVALDADARTVRLADGGTLPFDALVVATGARPRVLPGSPPPAGVHALRTADDCRRLRADVASAARAVVVGGGFIGCEVAASLRTLGLDVTVLEMAPAPLVGVLGAEVAGHVTRLHEAAGVRVLGDAAVAAVEGDGRVSGVRLADGTSVPADVVVLGLGVVPAAGWLDGSGVRVADGVVCDEYGETDVPGVYALGDVAAWRDPRTGRHRRFEHWTPAVEQAALVARTIAGAGREPYAAVPYFWSDQYRVKIQALGTPTPDADVTVVELAEGKRVALYAEDGVLTAVVGFSAASAVMAMRAALATPTPVEEALRLVAARRAAAR